MKYLIPLLILFASCDTTSKENKKETTIKTDLSHATSFVKKGGLSISSKLPAQFEAYQEVSIYPKVNAYVKSVLVDIGSEVKKGRILMVLEAPELVQSMEQSKERYLKSRTELNIDNEHYQRLLEAAKTPGAISQFDLSSLKSKVQADSAFSNAEKANWEVQKSMISYLNVTAPFDGVITERNVHTGALVSANMKDKPMLELKELNHLRLQVDVPEFFASQLKVNDSIQFFTSAYPGKKNIAIIKRKSNNINPQLRTEKFEMDVLNSNKLFFPGMYADILINLDGNKNAYVVPKTAVVTSTERKYVIIEINGKYEKVDVTTGNESSDKIEIFGKIKDGDKVLTIANDELK
jgi:RND family efflux transporter MFP subunit